MVVDSSALMAIIMSEPERPGFLDKLAGGGSHFISAATRVEVGIAALRRAGPEGEERLQELLDLFAIRIEPCAEDHVGLALAAFRTYGKGRHPAKLNFGDTFSYALAKATGEPLLFKGKDFGQTDIEPAV